jgi:hypothetical protein
VFSNKETKVAEKRQKKAIDDVIRCKKRRTVQAAIEQNISSQLHVVGSMGRPKHPRPVSLV